MKSNNSRWSKSAIVIAFAMLLLGVQSSYGQDSSVNRAVALANGVVQNGQYYVVNDAHQVLTLGRAPDGSVVYVPAQAPVVVSGYAEGPVYVEAPRVVCVTQERREGGANSMIKGAVIGAGVGAIIGNNSGKRDGKRGALIGGLVGAVLGSR